MTISRMSVEHVATICVCVGQKCLYVTRRMAWFMHRFSNHGINHWGRDHRLLECREHGGCGEIEVQSEVGLLTASSRKNSKLTKILHFWHHLPAGRKANGYACAYEAPWRPYEGPIQSILLLALFIDCIWKARKLQPGPRCLRITILLQHGMLESRKLQDKMTDPRMR